MKTRNLSHADDASRKSPAFAHSLPPSKVTQPGNQPDKPPGWASRYIAVLEQGLSVRFEPVGHSMTGRVNHGDTVEVRPFADGELPRLGDVVLCTVGIKQYLHLVKSLRGRSEFCIGNNRGGINGWVGAERLHGTLVSVNPSYAPQPGCVVF